MIDTNAFQSTRRLLLFNIQHIFSVPVEGLAIQIAAFIYDCVCVRMSWLEFKQGILFSGIMVAGNRI